MLQLVDMSEWLRRQTRNLLGFACTGSNPVVDVVLPCFFLKSNQDVFLSSIMGACIINPIYDEEEVDNE